MIPCAGHANGRGNTVDRYNRKGWLLSPESGFGGDHRRVPCYWCTRKLTRRQLTVDRWPVCGHRGGRYVRKNVVPSCTRCNVSRCSWRTASCRVS